MSGWGFEEDEVAEVLVDEAGLGASYDLDLDLADPESDAYLATVRVSSYFSEHPDADAAETAYAYRTDESNIPDAEDVDAESFGDESEVTQVGFQPEGGAAYAGYDLSLRVDRVYAGIQILVFGNDGEEVDEIDLPDLDDLAALAELLVPKIEAGLEGDADRVWAEPAGAAVEPGDGAVPLLRPVRLRRWDLRAVLRRGRGGGVGRGRVRRYRRDRAVHAAAGGGGGRCAGPGGCALHGPALQIRG